MKSHSECFSRRLQRRRTALGALLLAAAAFASAGLTAAPAAAQSSLPGQLFFHGPGIGATGQCLEIVVAHD